MEEVGLNKYGGSIAGYKLKITPPLLELQHAHTRYLATLSIWKQYIVWRYTAGSGQVNMTLIGMPNPNNMVYWVYTFFSLFSSNGIFGEPLIIEGPLTRWTQFFIDSKSYWNIPDPQVKINIAQEVILLYAQELQAIIMNAPVVQIPLTTYKTSSVYAPEMKPLMTQNLTSGEAEVSAVRIPQKPFNSTSYDPEFDFNYFIASSGDAVMWKLFLPQGTHCLFINPTYNAYPFEREILLPYGNVFEVYSVSDIQLDFVEKTELKIDRMQEMPFVIGEVYRPTPNVPHRIHHRKMRLLEAKLL
jgi:hypothetical protein